MFSLPYLTYVCYFLNDILFSVFGIQKYYPVVCTKEEIGYGTQYIFSMVLHSEKPSLHRGWSGGAKVLGKLPVLGRPTILNAVGQGRTALAVGAGRGCLDIFTLIYPFSSLSPSLWETARYRLKYCLKGPLNPKQPTNQPTHCII